MIVLISAFSFGAIPQGKWYCIQARYESTEFTDFEATFTILDATYYEADFEMGTSHGRSKSQYTYSGSEIFQTQMPTTIKLSGGGSFTSGGVLIFDYLLSCTQDLWDQAGVTALGCGLPTGQTVHRILYAMSGDTLLELKSPDQKTVLTYTFGAKRPQHNPVVFQVNMKVQKQLGNFNPDQGDKVVIRGSFNGWSGNAYELHELDTEGIYQTTIDFPGSQVAVEQEYKFVIADGTEIIEADPNRSFVLEPNGQSLGTAYFNRHPRADEVHPLAVTQTGADENSPSAAYNSQSGEFLVVWTKESADIYGQRMKADGTLSGSAFPISKGMQIETNPDVAYNSNRNEWLVVWEDNRNNNHDIYGARLGPTGKKLISPNAGNDSTFAICTQDSNQYAPRIAYNDIEDCYLVVWTDDRNMTYNASGWGQNEDIYGQRISGTGALLLPGDTQNPKVNFPIVMNTYDNEIKCDVAYCGRTDKILNEWMVVFERKELSMGNPRIWGVRIKGSNGARLDTWGNESNAGLAKSEGSAGPPWYPEFPVGWDSENFWGMAHVSQDCPHVESNDSGPDGLSKTNAEMYRVPEFLVVWTEYEYGKSDGDIVSQRAAYFPDSTAVRLGLKPSRGTDGMFTAVLVDQNGNWPVDPASWMTWPNLRVTTDIYEQSWNNIDYNSKDGTFLIVWVDWRSCLWDGSWEYNFAVPPSDIYGQRTYLNPADSSMAWIDHDGSWSLDEPLNVPLAFEDADEGNNWYPAVAHATGTGSLLVAYQYMENPEDDNTDILAVIYAGTPPVRSSVENRVAPEHFKLLQNYPNPFNPQTRIQYTIDSEARVLLKIFDILGRETAVLINERQHAGDYEVHWNGCDINGMPAASGVYILQMSIEKAGQSTTLNRKMVLVR